MDTQAVNSTSMVRALFSVAAVEGAQPPYDRMQLKVYYPGRYGDSLEERNMGLIPADDSQAPYPVLVMMPGSNCPPEGYSWLARRLAERGVATVLFSWIKEDMPGYVGLSPGFELGALTPDSYGTRPSSSSLPSLLAAIDGLNREGALAGCLDTERVVIGGHSAGGIAALLNANSEWFPQLKAVFSYAAHSGASTALGFAEDTLLALPSQLPCLIMGGTRDGVIAASSHRYGDDTDSTPTVRIERTFREALQSARGDSHLVLVEGANHFCFLAPDDGCTGRPFLDWEATHDGDALRDFFGELIGLFIDASVREDSAAQRQLNTWLDAGSPMIALHERK